MNASEAATVLKTSPAFQRLAVSALGLYLFLQLGTNSSTTSGGPLTWLPFWQLPGNAEGVGAIGPLSLLPILSAVAWLIYRYRARALRAIDWGPWRIVLPLGGLWLLAFVRACNLDGCEPLTWLRLLFLFAHMAWVYLLVVNERPNLFWVLTAIIAIQSLVAIAQFVTQGDVGLSFLGELPLAPAERGISVAMRGDVRWLRSYGLTIHPNTLVRTLIPTMFLLLNAIDQDPPSRRRTAIGSSVFILGYTAVLMALSRWGWVCLVLGGLIIVLPTISQFRQRRWAGLSPFYRVIWVSLTIVSILFLLGYGSLLVGRVIELDTPIESRSLWERQRDTNISLQLFREHPWWGVGSGRYFEAARANDAWADVVHSVPQLLAAELGVLGLSLWLVILLAPVARPGAFRVYSTVTALWLSFWLLGVLDTKPNPLVDLRSSLLIGLVAGVVALSIGTDIKHRLDFDHDYPSKHARRVDNPSPQADSQSLRSSGVAYDRWAKRPSASRIGGCNIIRKVRWKIQSIYVLILEGSFVTGGSLSEPQSSEF